MAFETLGTPSQLPTPAFELTRSGNEGIKGQTPWPKSLGIQGIGGLLRFLRYLRVKNQSGPAGRKRERGG